MEIPATEPEQITNDSRQTVTAAEQWPAPVRNPRLVVGGLDYFEMLMEQEEQA